MPADFVIEGMKQHSKSSLWIGLHHGQDGLIIPLFFRDFGQDAAGISIFKGE